MRRRIARAVVALIGAVAQFSPLGGGQDPNPAPKGPEFEVASIRYVEQPDFTQPIPQNRDPGFVIYRRISLRLLLMKAFGVAFYQCDGPFWLSHAFYDVTAKVPENASQGQIPAMLQGMLAERFALQFHWETRTESGYALVVGKNGPKLKKSEHIFPTMFKPSGHIQLGGITMQGFAESLSADMGRPVLNMTGLDGDFDIVMDVDPASIPVFAETMRSPKSLSEAEFAKPTIAVAVEGLGLKLESRKVPLEHLVVDQIKQVPTAN